MRGQNHILQPSEGMEPRRQLFGKDIDLLKGVNPGPRQLPASIAT